MLIHPVPWRVVPWKHERSQALAPCFHVGMACFMLFSCPALSKKDTGQNAGERGEQSESQTKISLPEKEAAGAINQ